MKRKKNSLEEIKFENYFDNQNILFYKFNRLSIFAIAIWALFFVKFSISKPFIHFILTVAYAISIIVFVYVLFLIIDTIVNLSNIVYKKIPRNTKELIFNLRQIREFFWAKLIVMKFSFQSNEKHVKSLFRSILSIVISFVLYIIVIMGISITTISFIADLKMSVYTMNLLSLTALLALFYVAVLITISIRIAQVRIRNDLQRIDEETAAFIVNASEHYGNDENTYEIIQIRESSGVKIISIQFRQILYLAPLALAWLAFIGLKM